MDQNRFVRWVNSSHCLAKIEPFMVPTIQGLGKLDTHLILFDEQYIQQIPRDPHNPQLKKIDIDFQDHLTLSYLWILGAYEIVRAVDQYCRENPDIFQKDINEKINKTKKIFERIRVPLAKFEPSWKNTLTDSKIAYPAIGPRGVSWHIAQNTYIQRRDLSDSLFDLLEEMNQCLKEG